MAAGQGPGSYAIKSDGTLWEWGLKYPDEDYRTSFVTNLVPVYLTDNCAAITASNHVLLTKTDGSPWAWGDNQSSQIGDGVSRMNCPTPVRIMEGVKLSS